MTDLEEAESIVNTSGNNFHCKVVNYLTEKGWNTLISPYYMDNASNKPREIDLIAEKSWLYDHRHESKYGTINVKLFIECKYIPQKNVFWFSNKDMLSAEKWVTLNTPLRANNMFTERHHYLAKNKMVAKLFASKNKPKVENEVIYKALNQSLNAMVYLRHKESIIKDKNNQHSNILSTIELPVIMCNSFENFYRVDMTGIGKPHKIEDNFQLEVNYAYVDYRKNQTSEYFLLDIVDFTKLDNYLELIEADVNAIFQIL